MAASRKSLSTEVLPGAVARCLARHVRVGQSIVVGLSGGVDSVVLLHALRIATGAVAALHVHHGLNRDADAWEDFCRRLCRDLGVDLQVQRVSVERDSPDGLEGAARRARHGVFERTAADWIALGHHRGDRAETVLFNLLRGAGPRGAGAMPQAGGRLLRPLLPCGRDEILRYARLHGLPWVEDGSNEDRRFARNFLRHRVLPEIGSRFPDAEARLAAGAERFAEAADLLDDLALLDLRDQPPDFPVPVALLAGLSEPRARNVLRYLLYRRGVGIPSEARLTESLRQFLVAAPDRHPAVSFGPWLLRRRARSIFLDGP